MSHIANPVLEKLRLVWGAFGKLTQILAATLLIFTLCGAGQANALSSVPPTGPIPLGTCTVSIFSDGAKAYVTLTTSGPSGQTFHSGGTAWGLNGVETHDAGTGSPHQSITSSAIQTCFFSPGSVTLLEQNGADNGSYALDDYMGFSFQMDGSSYEYALSGADSTQQITNGGTPTDTTAPSVEILGAPAVIFGVDPFDVTIEFSEDVLNFVAGDVSVTKGSVTGFTVVDGNTFIATITPTGAGEVTIEVAAAVAKDAAGNDNTAATPVTIGNTIVEDTQKDIASFMLNKASQILSNQPDLTGFLHGTNSGGGGGPLGYLGINGNDDNMDFSFSSSLSKVDRARAESLQQLATRRVSDAHSALTFAAEAPNAAYGEGLAGNGYMPTRKYDIWTQIYGSTTSAGDSDSTFWIGYLGAHYFVTPDMIIGGLVQLDWADEDNGSTGSSADGQGWMIGPYIAGRITGTGLNYEARASWGQSSNNVSPLGTYTDAFETERWLASFKLNGNYKLDSVTFRPSVSVSYFEEEQKSYTDSLTNTIPSQTVSLGEVRFGPEFVQNIALADGSLLQPSIGVSGIWNFGVDGGANTQSYALGTNDLRARVNAGFSLSNPNDMVFSASAFYDGLGIEDYESMGGRATLSIPIR